MLLHEIIKHGNRQDIAVLDKGKKITYEQLSEAIENYRNKLYKIGIRQGDRIAIFSDNNAEFIYLYFAVASLGAINVPINFQLSNREVAYILKDAGIEHIFTHKPIDLSEYLNDSDSHQKVTQHDIKILDHSEDKIEAAPKLPDDFDDKNPCTIIYTSGTTGNPKGAVLSHRNLVRNSEQFTVMNCKRENKVLCALPMYHAFGLTCSVLYTFYCGAEVVILKTFILKDMLDIIKSEQITDIYLVPSVYSLMVKLADPTDLKSLRLVVSGGANLPAQVSIDFQNKFGLPIYEGYGLSEASPVVTVHVPGSKIKIGSIGPFLPDIEARFVDSEGNDVPKGQAGELLIKGDNIMLGYWNNPKATAEVLDSNHWLHTGDVARIDEEGYVYIVTRLKEMFISMGENVYPQEVEEVIYKFPNIKDAAVIGIEDNKRGQVGVCFYSTQDKSGIDVEDLKRFLQKNLALYKIPRDFHELDELPKTSTGKISKRKLVNEIVGNL